MVDVFDLNFADVQDRLYSRYLISPIDAELAIKYLKSFFHAKRKNIDTLIIMPQIADWAWHELILDTRRYRALCYDVFGSFLHHVANNDVDKRYGSSYALPEGQNSADLRSVFQLSLEMFESEYGLGLGDTPPEWQEAGWDKPRYRLRDPSVNLLSSDEEDFSFCRNVPDFLSWLPERISRRFGLSQSCACNATVDYAAVFISCAEVLPYGSALCHIAWQEHILWTERYLQDCTRIVGRFVEHAPSTSKFINGSHVNEFGVSRLAREPA